MTRMTSPLPTCAQTRAWPLALPGSIPLLSFVLPPRLESSLTICTALPRRPRGTSSILLRRSLCSGRACSRYAADIARSVVPLHFVSLFYGLSVASLLRFSDTSTLAAPRAMLRCAGWRWAQQHGQHLLFELRPSVSHLHATARAPAPRSSAPESDPCSGQLASRRYSTRALCG